MLRDLGFRIRALFRRSEMEAELDAELRSHLDHEIGKLIRQGLSPEDAERSAKRAFGGFERIKDDTRDARGLAWLDAFAQDVKHTARAARKRPGFAMAVVLTLGLGLGANVAMFGIVDRLLLRAPAYMKDPARVHRVYLVERNNGSDVTDALTSYARYKDLARLSSTFSSVAAFKAGELSVGVGDETRLLQIGTVSASYFDLFDARPVIGRFITARDDSSGAAAAVAVLSWSFWQTRYGGRNIIGEVLDIGSLKFTIIGVAPQGFRGVDLGNPVVAFIPINAYAASTGFLQHPSDFYTQYNYTFTEVLARRPPDVSVSAATADLTHAFQVSYELERTQTPGVPPIGVAQPRAAIGPIQSDRGPKTSNVARVALWTGGVALIVLLIACANVANLCLVRALERRRDHALRLALGVSRARLMMHAMTEIVLFAGVAALVGVGIAFGGTQFLRRLFLPGVTDVGVFDNSRTLAFAGLAALLATLLTSIAPALYAARGTPGAVIKDGGSGAGHRTSRVRTALLLVQGVMSVVLLVGAGLFVRSLYNVRTLRLGYDAEPVLFLYVDWRGVTPSAADRIALSHRLADDARTIPGVTGVALGLSVPFAIMLTEDLFTVHHDTVPNADRFTLQSASLEYFRTVGTQVLRGRSFSEADRTGSAPVMMVSEAMARTLWPGQEAIGECLRVGADTMPCATIVGITEDIKQSSMSDDPGLQFYLPIGQYTPERASLFVRVNGAASHAAETVRRRLQQLMPGASFITVMSVHDILDRETRSWQLGATMFVAFGVLALILAAIGLYSVIAYGVAQRTRELGVRVALGARVGDVLWLVLQDGVRFTILGLGLGSVIALAAGHWIAPLLFGERPTDPLVFGAVTGVLVVAAVVASIVPALHASRVDPSVALRAD